MAKTLFRQSIRPDDQQCWDYSGQNVDKQNEKQIRNLNMIMLFSVVYKK